MQLISLHIAYYSILSIITKYKHDMVISTGIQVVSLSCSRFKPPGQDSLVMLKVHVIMSVSEVAKSMVISCWLCFVLRKKMTIFCAFGAMFWWTGWLYTGPQGHSRRALGHSKECRSVRGLVTQTALGYLDQFLLCQCLSAPRGFSGKSTRNVDLAKDVDSWKVSKFKGGWPNMNFIYGNFM